MSVSIKDLLEAGCHFGHQTKFWDPKMKEYIYGVHNKIHIINLDKTLPLLNDAIKFAKQTVKNKGNVLFVGAKVLIVLFNPNVMNEETRKATDVQVE